MWKLLKAEFSYYQYIFSIVFSLIMLFMILFIVYSNIGNMSIEKDSRGAMTLMFSATFITLFVMLLHRSVNKIDRFHILLPVTVRMIGITRLSVILIFWLGMAVLFWLSYAVIKSTVLQTGEDNSLYVFLTLNGVIFIANAAYLIARDLAFFFTGKFRGVPGILIPLFIFLAGVLYVSFFTPYFLNYVSVFVSPELVRESITSHIFVPAVLAAINIAGIGLSVLGVFIFTRRVSYAH